MPNKPQARSRLQKKSPVQEKKPGEFASNQKKSQPHSTKKGGGTSSSKKIQIPLKKYFKHIPALFLCLPFYWLVYFLFTHIHPAEIKNFLIVGSYLPLQIPLFLANFFFFSFLTLKTRRGFMISFFISLILFLKLQNVILNGGVMVIILGGFVVGEVISSIIAKSQ